MTVLGAVGRGLSLAGKACQLAAWLPAGHLAVLSVAGSLPAPPLPAPRRRRAWVVLTCAHDEEAIVADAVGRAFGLARPGSPVRVVVVADNCSDKTAARAAAAGAEVWERDDAENRGKGAALRFGIDRLLTEPGWEALLVLDADAGGTPGLLDGLDARLDAGHAVLQTERRVSNGSANALTRLSVISSASATVLRPRGRERLGLPAMLVGTGMAFDRGVLEQVPWQATGLVEDMEQGLLLLAAGHRPRFESRVRTDDLMPETMAQTRRQRERWAEGRGGVVRQYAREYLGRAVASRDPLLAETVASELLLPKLSMTGAAIAAGWLLRSVGERRIDRAGPVQAGLLGGHLVAGLRASEAGPDAYAALALAPAAAAWKVVVLARGKAGALHGVSHGTRAHD